MRRRTASHGPLSDVVCVYRWGDGTASPLPGVVHPFESPFVAVAAWPAYRVAVWDDWLETSRDYTRPPRAACVYDNLTRATADAGWPVDTVDAGKVVAAAEEDLSAIADFRAEHPKQAEAISEALAEFEAAVRVMAELARATADDPAAARAAYLGRPKTRIQGARRSA